MSGDDFEPNPVATESAGNGERVFRALVVGITDYDSPVLAQGRSVVRRLQ